MKKVNLFCIPFAGGSEYSYKPYQYKSPDLIQIRPLKLPGRGSRINEQLIVDLDILVEDTYSQIKNQLEKPYAIFGHSMGSLLAYLLTIKIMENNHKLPFHLFLTGSRSPTERDSDIVRHKLPKNRFIEELNLLGGSPNEVLEDGEMLNFFEPILRADFQAIETYSKNDFIKLDIPITVIIGAEEKTTYEEAAAWSKLSNRTCETIQFPGNHFFIFDYVEKILEIFADKLLGNQTQVYSDPSKKNNSNPSNHSLP